MTLRTLVALRAIELLAGHDEGWVVGAGTVTTAAEYQSVVEAGARFAVSSRPDARAGGGRPAGPIPLLPGVMTAKSSMHAIMALASQTLSGRTGRRHPLLNAIHGPLPDIRFCPTGGVGPANLTDYLKLPTCSASAAPG